MNLGQAILDLFDDPTAVWKRVFDSLDPGARRTFLTLASLPEPADLSELESVVLGQKGAFPLDSLDLALKALDDTFITIAPFHGWSRNRASSWTTRWAKSERAVSFRNPGLLDFAQSMIEESPARLAALEPLARFEQVVEIVDLACSRLSAAPVFPKTKEFVLGWGDHYLSLAAALFVDAPACSLSGLQDAARLFALLRVMHLLRESADPSMALAQSVVRTAWDELLEQDPRLEVAELMSASGIAKVVRESLGRSGVADYAELVAEQPATFDSIEILEALRQTEPLDVHESRIRQEFEDFIRKSLKALDDRHDHDDIRAELRQLEELNDWVSDELWVEAMGGYEDRAAATAEPSSDEYREQSKKPLQEATPEKNSDAYLAGLFGLLLRQP